MGVRGVLEYVRAMSAVARHGAKSPLIVPLRMLSSPSAIERWVEEHVIHVRSADPVTEEILSPHKMVLDAALDGRCCGDADDVAVLTAALGLAAGLDAQFVLVAFDGRTEPSHVFTRLKRPEEAWGDDPLADKPFADRATHHESFSVEEPPK